VYLSVRQVITFRLGREEVSGSGGDLGFPRATGGLDRVGGERSAW
jgi:hypothetical protein